MQSNQAQMVWPLPGTPLQQCHFLYVASSAAVTQEGERKKDVWSSQHTCGVIT